MNPNSIQAPYLKIKNKLIAAIKNGTYGPKDKVPSENELMKEHGVARMTANRALRELTDEGVLTRVRGIGTFVAEQRGEGHDIEVKNIADEIRARGHRYRAEVILRQEETAEVRVSQLFHLKEGACLYRTRIVHMEGDMPLQLEDRWVNPAIVPEYLFNDFQKTTPTAYLLSKVPLQELEHTIRAEMPNAEFRDLLHMPEGEPCLVLTRRTWLNEQVITFVRLYYPGTRYRLGNKSNSKASIE